MNVSAHLARLREKHAELESKIDEEQQRPAPDTFTLHDLKKQKLKIKEQIAELSRQPIAS